MKILSKLNLAIALTAVMVVTTCVTVVVVQNRLDTLSRERLELNQVLRAISELQVLTYDALFRGGERARLQWFTRWKSGRDLLLTHSTPGSKLYDVHQQLLDRMDNLYRNFEDLTAQTTLGQEPDNGDKTRKRQHLSRMLIDVLEIGSRASTEAAGAETEAAAIRHFWRNLKLSLLTGCGLVLVSLGFWLRASITNPLKHLHQGVSIIGDGNLEHRVKLDTDDELAELASEINLMADRLRETLASRKDLEQEVTLRMESELAMRQSRRDLELISENSPQKIFYKNIELNYVSVNSQYAAALGLTQEEMLGKDDYAFYPVYLAEKYRADDRRIMSTGKGETLEEQYQGANGEDVWIETFKAPVRNEENQVIGVLGMFSEITERKRQEAELQELNSRLQRSNADLQQFAYVASHDLQEPLRMVGSYLQLIERRYNDKLDDTGREFMAFAVDGAQRMQQLIQSLLQYARVESRGQAFTLVNCNEALQNVRKNLGEAVSDTNAKLICQTLPEVWGDSIQLGQVFQNLISNALKFHEDNTPEVSISAIRTNEWKGPDHPGLDRPGWLFSVSDNGIGMDPQYAERIFVIFQRLHSRDEYPGTGIGLSLCKRIVERHGGEIWVESTPGKGTCFYFTIPDTAVFASASGSRPIAPVHEINKQKEVAGIV